MNRVILRLRCITLRPELFQSEIFYTLNVLINLKLTPNFHCLRVIFVGENNNSIKCLIKVNPNVIYCLMNDIKNTSSFIFYLSHCKYKSRHMTKPTKWHVCPAKTDQPGHPASLNRVFAVRMKKTWVLSYQMSAQRRLCSDWADAQAYLSLRWARSHFVGFVMRRLSQTDPFATINGKIKIT